MSSDFDARRLLGWQTVVFAVTFIGYAATVLQRKAFALVIPYIDASNDTMSTSDMGRFEFDAIFLILL